MTAKGRGFVSRDLVIAAYQALLGRPPENEQVVTEKITQCESEEAVLRQFVTSPEFLYRHSNYSSAVKEYYHATLEHVDVNVPQDVFDRLFSRIKEQWIALGHCEPFWSVLANDRFRMESIDKNQADFYKSGEKSDRLIDIFSQRTKVASPAGVCLELGCGVGRVTRFLARRFGRVLGVDISDGNLALAQRYLQNEHIDNVDWLLLRNLQQLEEVESFDFFHSVHVLQHNPPPVIARLLRVILNKLRSGGAFLFQVPIQLPHYAFSTAAYLESPNLVGKSFEMHALPMYAVLDIIAEAGGRVKEVMSDTWSGTGSHTFFGIKP